MPSRLLDTVGASRGHEADEEGAIQIAEVSAGAPHHPNSLKFKALRCTLNVHRPSFLYLHPTSILTTIDRTPER